MRIGAVRAHAFGPLVERTLELAPGLTVVVGPNESGKSTWHAALYAGLCGRARRRGRLGPTEQRFVDRHRPWDRDEWSVSAVVTLDDGRRVELHQDLTGRRPSTALDVDLGRDVTEEILAEGAPDGSRWLGLDRRAFAATACVFQTQVLAVLAGADGLQGALQRAVSGGEVTGASTADALARISAYRRERIGRDDPRSDRPLRRASQSVAAAEWSVREAAASHQLYLDALADLDGRRARAAAAGEQLGRAEAARAARQAEIATRLARVRALEEKMATPAAWSGAKGAPALPSSQDPARPGRVRPDEAGERSRTLRGLILAGGLLAAFGVGLVAAGGALLGRPGRGPDPVLALGAGLALGGVLLAGLKVAATRRARHPVHREGAGRSADAGSPGPRGASASREPGVPTPDALVAEVRRERAALDLLYAGGPPDAMAELRHEVQSAEREVAAAEGALGEMMRSLPSVAEAEEELAQARARRARLQALDRTLAITAGFLQSAQDKVQRDAAPALNATLGEWLPRIIPGRYAGAAVDPATLAVQVREADGPWRTARDLSQGTAEQVYLLLRAALVRHLTAGFETCPLLLDDVTVQADPERLFGVLELLHDLAAERQVVVFAQSGLVGEWARGRLDPSRDRLVNLEPARRR